MLIVILTTFPSKNDFRFCKQTNKKFERFKQKRTETLKNYTQ